MKKIVNVFNSPICLKILNIDLEWLYKCEKIIENFSFIDENKLIITDIEAVSFLSDYLHEWSMSIKGSSKFLKDIVKPEYFMGINKITEACYHYNDKVYRVNLNSNSIKNNKVELQLIEVNYKK
jgi:hypothetical protein